MARLRSTLLAMRRFVAGVVKPGDKASLTGHRARDSKVLGFKA